MGKAVEKRQKCVVTGGKGYVAQRLVVKLAETGKWIVRMLDFAPQMEVEEKEGEIGRAMAARQVHYLCVDLCNREEIFRVCRGVAVVFHLAEVDGGDDAVQQAVNVSGTRNVIDACVRCGVRKLIYSSSASVLFDGRNSLVCVDESSPYPASHLDSYSRTKAEGEKLVLAANGMDGLVTAVIRLSGVFGPGEKRVFPALIQAAKRASFSFVLGDGDNMFDWTFVENAAHAFLCAEKALLPEGDAAGKVFLITNGEPRNLWEFLGQVLTGLGYRKPRRKLPLWLVLPLAQAGEWMMKQMHKDPGIFTPARIGMLTAHRTFNISRARQLLHYSPQVTLDQGIRQTVEYFAHLTPDASPKVVACTATHGFLGGGLLADLLLWRDWKDSFGWLCAGCLVYHLLFFRGYTLIALIANLLFIAMAASYCYNYLRIRVTGMPANFASCPPELSEESAISAALAFRSAWNRAAAELKASSQGDHVFILFRILLFLRTLNLFVATFSLQNLAMFALISVSSLPFLCEKNEARLGHLVRIAGEEFQSYKDYLVRRLTTSSRFRP